MRPRTIFQLARASDRDYVTPEDVVDSLRSGCSKERVRLHVLQAIGGQRGCGVEDEELAAFIAARGTPGK